MKLYEIKVNSKEIKDYLKKENITKEDFLESRKYELFEIFTDCFNGKDDVNIGSLYI